MNSEEAGFSQRINRLHLFANLSTPFATRIALEKRASGLLRGFENLLPLSAKVNVRKLAGSRVRAFLDFPSVPFFFTFFLDSCVFQVSRKVEIANKARIKAYPCEYCQISPTSASLFVQVKGTIGGIASQRSIYIRQPLVDSFLRGT